MMKKGAMHKIAQNIREWGEKAAVRLEQIPMKRMAVYAGILFVLSLIPLLALGRYNVMCIDDYDYGRQIHDTWMETGSLLQSVQTAWRQNMEFYREWQGTYISCFLMGLCPMNFRYDIAWVVPIIMIGMFSVSTYVLGRHILHRWLGLDQAGGSFVMFMLLFMFYQVLEAPFEGIYWYNGSTHYILMESVWFFTLTTISAGLWTQKKSKEVLCCIAAAILSVIVGGGNLITALQAEIVMAFLVVCAVMTNRRKIVMTAVPFVTGSIGFLLNVLAPGNALRDALDMDEGYSAVMSVLLSFYYMVVFIIRWTPVFVILIWMLVLPVLWKLAKRSDKTFRHPVWVTLGAVSVLAAMFTPTLYAVGMVGLSRVDNIIQMVYYLAFFAVTAYWLGYFAHRRCDNVSDITMQSDMKSLRTGEALGLFLEKAGMKMTALFLLITLIVWVFTANKNTYASISALRSLANGEAQTFYAEAMARHDIYIDDMIMNVEVEPYSAKPALFDFIDLSEDAGNWINLAVARYYHKENVKCLKD